MMKMVLDEELRALLLLSFLSDGWETLVISLSNSSLEDLIALAMVKNCMLNKEDRRKEQEVLSHNEALVIERKRRSKHRGSQFNSNDGRTKSQGRSKNSKMENVTTVANGTTLRKTRNY